jgi:hypothetical protein
MEGKMAYPEFKKYSLLPEVAAQVFHLWRWWKKFRKK